MVRLLCFIVAMFSIGQVVGQSIDWLETVIIEEFKGKAILIKQVDSLKPKCKVGRDLNYCTESEKLFDSKVLEFRKEQKDLIGKYDLDIAITSGDDIDADKYRFLIDYDFDLMNIAKERSSIHYLKFDFLIIDLQSSEVVGRSSCENLKNPFDGFEYLLETIVEFQSESFEAK